MTDRPLDILSSDELNAFVARNSTLQNLLEGGLNSRTIKAADLAVFVRNIRKTGGEVLEALENRRKELQDPAFTLSMLVAEFATIVRGAESNLHRGPAEDPEELDKETHEFLREWERDRDFLRG